MIPEALRVPIPAHSRRRSASPRRPAIARSGETLAIVVLAVVLYWLLSSL